MLGTMLRRIERRFNEKWLAPGEPSLPYLEKLLKQTRSSALFVTGEMDPGLYEHSTFPMSLEQALARGVDVGIIFHKEAGSIEQAKEETQNENPSLVALSRKYPERLKLYWRATRPEGHFAVFDADGAFVEKPHLPYSPRPAVVKTGTIDLGKHLQERFQLMSTNPQCERLKYI